MQIFTAIARSTAEMPRSQGGGGAIMPPPPQSSLSLQHSPVFLGLKINYVYEVFLMLHVGKLNVTVIMIYVKCEHSKFPVLHNKLEIEINSMNVMKFKEFKFYCMPLYS